MTQNLPSIEDLLKKSDDSISAKAQEDFTAQEKFSARMKEIRAGEKETATRERAKKSGVPYLLLKGFAISPEALSLVPEDTAQVLRAVTFLHTGPELRMAAIDPADHKVQELAFQLGERNKAHVNIYQVSEEGLSYALDLYRAIPKIKKIVKGVQLTQAELNRHAETLHIFTDVGTILHAAHVTDVVSIVIAAALHFDSSDIHVEAEERGVKGRLRVDGGLEDVAELPKESWKKIISRLKLISGLKINVTNRPQDGRFTIFLDAGNTDVRVSTLPTTWGESVVMRLLKPSTIQVKFEELGFRVKAQARLEAELRKPHGMVITTGPTGSGKTTTLYAILRKLNQPDVKIITLEDPIEYKLEGINQSQVDASKNYTFAGGLRSILRQDPDIVMVGEIRDAETADTAVNAALTGHLLLSTIHTNDAAGAIPRFMNMGVKPFLLAQALNAVMGQRLVRRLCPKGKVEVKIPAADLQRTLQELKSIPETSGESAPDAITWYGPGEGCGACHGGYKGRVGIYEVLVVDTNTEAAMREGVLSEAQMREIAQAQGMVTMLQDGLLKAAEGVTSIEEVFRVALT